MSFFSLISRSLIRFNDRTYSVRRISEVKVFLRCASTSSHNKSGQLRAETRGGPSGYESGTSSDESSSESSSSSDTEDDRRGQTELYSGHIPTSFVQRVMLTVGSAAAAISDPYRDDMVAVFGETTGHYALRKLYSRMSEDKEGRRILMERPVINTTSVDYDYLRSLPVNTFGHHYAQFMVDNNISADSRKPVKFVDDPELAYVMRRYRETHDLVHALLGMRTNMLGEVTIKWVEALQTDLPMAWAGSLFGATRLAPKQRRAYIDHMLPWALRCGHQAKLFMNVHFERRWEQDLEELRLELDVPDLPSSK